MTFRHLVFETDEGFHYAILPASSDSPLISSGAFLRREDADRLGRHFAADADSMNEHLKRK